MSVTITLHLWWLWVYLVFGVAIQPWLLWHYWKTTHNRRPLWETIRRGFRPLAFVVSIVLWPWALWEDLR